MDIIDVTPITFDDLAPVEVQVSYKGEKYVLCEATADTAVKYRNAAISGARMTDGKVTGVDRAADVEPLLVGLCLFKLEGPDGKTRVQVGEARVRTWPAKVTRVLFDRAKHISGLDEREDTVEDIVKKINDLHRKRQELLAKRDAAGKVQTGDGPVCSDSPGTSASPSTA